MKTAEIVSRRVKSAFGGKRDLVLRQQAKAAKRYGGPDAKVRLPGGGYARAAEVLGEQVRFGSRRGIMGYGGRAGVVLRQKARAAKRDGGPEAMVRLPGGGYGRAADILSSVLQIKTVAIGGRIEVSSNLCTYELWERLCREDQTLPKPDLYYRDTGGSEANLRCPVRGISYESAEKAVGILYRVTGERWFVPAIEHLQEAKEFGINVDEVFGDNDSPEMELTSTDADDPGEKVVVNLRYNCRSAQNVKHGSSNIGHLAIRFAKKT